MKRLLYIAILLCTLLCGCHGNNGIFEYLLTEFSNLFIKGHSIEMDGLVGCDTVPLPGDKEQIAASFLANIDTLWVQMRDSLAKHPDVKFGKYIKEEDFLYDPALAYKINTYYISERDTALPIEELRVFLPKRPSVFYHVWTDLIIYSKDKLLCWAFVFICQDEDKDGSPRPPFYKGLNIIGKRESVNEPFRIYTRGESYYTFRLDRMSAIRNMENHFLYVAGPTYQISDVYSIADKKRLPILSDPDFFEKHPLFHKFNDSTYNFEWYDSSGGWRQEKGEPVMYRYPY